MRVPFVDLATLHREIAGELREAVDDVWQRSAFTGAAAVEEFEQGFAAYCGSEHCVATGSGTAALEILLRAYGIGPGDEVVLPVNTFIATAEAVALVGARPVFVDVQETDGLIDFDGIDAAINSATRALIPVHLYGHPVDMDQVARIARRHGLLVIEDASQAHGARFREQRTGALADAAAFSFYPAKNLGACGEAGGITTRDAEIAERARMLRDHGARQKHCHEVVGRNDRMDGIQAAILKVKLHHLDRWNQQRRQIAAWYMEAIPEIRHCHAMGTGGDHVFHLMVVRVPRRDQVRQALMEQGIQTGVHYPTPLHLQPAFAHLQCTVGEFPVAEKLAEEILSVPMHPHLSREQVNYVTAQLRDAVHQG